MNIPAGYKMTEIGVIPEDWEVKFVFQVAPLQRGFDLPNNKIKLGKIPIVYSSGIEKFHNYAMVKGPGVITGRSGTLGEVYYVETDYWPHNTSLWVTHFYNSVPKFIFYVYKSLNFERFSSGSGVPTLNRNDIHGISIPLPPLPEQTAIAAALSDVDALLAAQDALIVKKTQIKNATMQQLLSGKKRLPGFSGAWEVRRLGEVAILKNGYAFKSETYTNLGEFKVIAIANVQNGYMQSNDCNRIAILPNDIQPHQILNQGDILISMTGNVGRVCRVNDRRCLLNQRVGKIVPIDISADFLFILLCQSDFIFAMLGVAKGGAQPNLSIADIKSYELNIPVDLKEQTAIATVLNDMDEEIAALKRQREKTQQIKHAMMQELLTGKMRLI